jgi:hypothetical protein
MNTYLTVHNNFIPVKWFLAPYLMHLLGYRPLKPYAFAHSVICRFGRTADGCARPKWIDGRSDCRERLLEPAWTDTFSENGRD